MLKVPLCSEPNFSQALAELEAIHGKAYRNYTDDHTKLFLTVQNKVRWAGHSFDRDGDDGAKHVNIFFGEQTCLVAPRSHRN